MSRWSEIRNDLCDEHENKILIYAREINGSREDRKTIAKISIKTCEVEYLNEVAKTDFYAQEVIMNTIRMIIAENAYTCPNCLSVSYSHDDDILFDCPKCGTSLFGTYRAI